MSLNANAMTTLAMAKSYLKLPAAADANNDPIVELFINSSSEYIERECDRIFKQATYNEIRSGRKQNIILLKQWPVTTISAVYVDSSGQFGAGTALDATDYQIGDDGNSLILMSGVFPNGYNNVKITYQAGYATIPSDLEHACLWGVSFYRNLRDGQDIGRPQKSKGDENTQISQAMPQDVRDCIARYKRTEMPLLDALTANE